jgi:hypothetical protein
MEIAFCGGVFGHGHFGRNFGRRRDWFVDVGHVHILLLIVVDILRVWSTAPAAGICCSGILTLAWRICSPCMTSVVHRYAIAIWVWEDQNCLWINSIALLVLLGW